MQNPEIYMVAVYPLCMQAGRTTTRCRMRQSRRGGRLAEEAGEYQAGRQVHPGNPGTSSII